MRPFKFYISIWQASALRTSFPQLSQLSQLSRLSRLIPLSQLSRLIPLSQLTRLTLLSSLWLIRCPQSLRSRGTLTWCRALGAS